LSCIELNRGLSGAPARKKHRINLASLQGQEEQGC
jgi:hypothetical protein